MKSLKRLAAAAALVALTGAAQAALIDRGGGLVYDSTVGITWLADMNYAQTSGHAGNGVETNGRMTWFAATTWIRTLNTNNYAGHNDWRLPTQDVVDASCSQQFSAGGSVEYSYGNNCIGGELGDLFITKLGIRAGESLAIQTGDTDEQIHNLALFSNVQVGSYWSSSTYANTAAAFNASDGSKNMLARNGKVYALAVRTGDEAAPVPEPQTLALVMLALGATVVARRRRPD